MIRIKNLKHDYPLPSGPPKTVLSIPELTIEEGALAALAGPSGSGKTTLLLLIGGLIKPTGGEIWLGDAPVHRLAAERADRFRAAHVGFIFQSFNLVQSLTVEENLFLASRFAPRRPRRDVQAWIEGLLARVGMAGHRHRFPRQLSMGEQQRVAVARARVNRPRVILADEPTAHLDAPTAHEVVSLLLEAADETGATLLCASHDPAVLARFQPENTVVMERPADVEGRVAPTARRPVTPAVRLPDATGKEERL